MDHEHNQQIAKEGGAGSPRNRQGGPAPILSPLQPKGFHPAATVRLPRSQAVLQDRLPRHHGDSGRHAQCLPGHRAPAGPAKRLLRNAAVQKLLDASVDRTSRGGRRQRVKRAAVDSTGFEVQQTSHYFVRRRAKGRKDWQITTYKRFPKLDLLVDCSNHMVLAAMAERGPGPDITHVVPIVYQACGRAEIETLLADAGYDAEWVHWLGREAMEIRTLIPPKIGRPTDKPPTGYYRRLMSQRLHLTCYGQRWQVETVMSMVKRRQGSAVNARTYWSQCRALMLKAVTHNILILYALTESTRQAA